MKGLFTSLIENHNLQVKALLIYLLDMPTPDKEMVIEFRMFVAAKIVSHHADLHPHIHQTLDLVAIRTRILKINSTSEYRVFYVTVEHRNSRTVEHSL